MHIRLPLLLVLPLAPLYALAQTDPVPQALPYQQDFTALVHGDTIYPEGWQGWRTSTTSVGTTYNTAAPIRDLDLVPFGTAVSTEYTYAVYNYDGKIGFFLGNTVHSHLVLAVNTTGASGVTVEYDAMTIKNPGSNSQAMAMQYRVGTSGVFTVVPETEYTNPVVPVQLDSSTTPIAVERMRATLPRDCDNQPVVQLRWTTRRISSGVNGPSFAVDSVRVFSTNVGLDGLGSMLTLRWLGQDAEGGHLVDAGNTIVSGWEVLDATGRSIGASGAGHRSAGGRVRIDMAGRGTGIYLVRVLTDRGVGVVRLAHSGG